MAKIVLNVENSKNLEHPSDQDLLLYNKSKEMWYRTSKSEITFEQDTKIKKLENEMAAFTTKTNKDIALMKKTISDTIELVEPYIKSQGEK